MNVITWLVVGGLVGWLGSAALRVDSQERMFLNVAIGMVAAAFSGWFLTPLVGIAAIHQGGLNIGGVVVSFVGAAVVLAVVLLAQRVAVR